MHLKTCLITLIAFAGLGFFATPSAEASGGFSVGYHNNNVSVRVGYNTGYHHRRHYGYGYNYGYYRPRYHGYYRPRVVYYGGGYGCYPRYNYGYYRRPVYGGYYSGRYYYDRARRNAPVYRAHRGTAKCYTPGYGY